MDPNTIDTDLIDTLLGLPAGDPALALRMERPDIRRHTEGAFRALVTPAAPGNLPCPVRAALAEAAARLDGGESLAAFYATLPQADPDPGLLAYVNQVAADPAGVDQAMIDSLRAGLTPQDIVAVTQLAAFVPFQVRLLAGLRAMAPTAQAAPHGPVHAAPGPFTMAEVGWAPRVPPVEAEGATAAQLAALDACPPAVRRSVYFRTLALDPASLAERGALFDRVMYAPRGLPRAERELATAAVSMVNGCVYCTSVHARRFAELSHEPQTMQHLLDAGLDAALDARRRAVVDIAATLTAAPAAVDLAPARNAGLTPLEILDLIHSVAMFANANRLMQALGEATPPRAA